MSWGWLNPLQWIKVLSLMKSLWDGAVSLYKAYQESKRQKQQQREIEQAEQAVADLDRANEIEDDDERLRKKAEAACRLERTLNPDADCDPNPRGQ